MTSTANGPAGGQDRPTTYYEASSAYRYTGAARAVVVVDAKAAMPAVHFPGPPLQ